MLRLPLGSGAPSGAAFPRRSFLAPQSRRHRAPLARSSCVLVPVGGRVQPAHHLPQRAADLLDLAACRGRAEPLEVGAAAAVLGDPLPRELARPAAAQPLGHALPPLPPAPPPAPG